MPEDAQITMAKAIERTKNLIAEQEARIVRLRSLGAPTRRSREFLSTLHNTLNTQEMLLRLIISMQQDVAMARTKILTIEHGSSIASSTPPCLSQEAGSS
jgi:hypothetical protein